MAFTNGNNPDRKSSSKKIPQIRSIPFRVSTIGTNPPKSTPSATHVRSVVFLQFPFFSRTNRLVPGSHGSRHSFSPNGRRPIGPIRVNPWLKSLTGSVLICLRLRLTLSRSARLWLNAALTRIATGRPFVRCLAFARNSSNCSRPLAFRSLVFPGSRTSKYPSSKSSTAIVPAPIDRINRSITRPGATGMNW